MSRTILMKLSLVAITVIILFAGFQVPGFGNAPEVNEADACNPCDCAFDRRINCQGIQFYAVYARPRETQIGDPNYVCEINVWRLGDDDEGFFAFKIDRFELAAMTEAPAENTLIDSRYDISFYHLASGEFQVNAGPDDEGKVYTIIFEGCPATNVREAAID